jgi:hypothetical protein
MAGDEHQAGVRQSRDGTVSSGVMRGLHRRATVSPLEAAVCHGDDKTAKPLTLSRG